MGLQPFPKVLSLLEGLIAETFFENLILAFVTRLSPHFVLPRKSEDEVELIMKVVGLQRFPFSLVKPKPPAGRAFDSEGEPVTDFVALHREPAFWTKASGGRLFLLGKVFAGSGQLRKTLRMFGKPAPVGFRREIVALGFRAVIGD